MALMTENNTLEVNGKVWDFSKKTYVMGILNMSSESFTKHSVASGLEEALDRARKLADDGADIIDVGGRSSATDTPEVTTEQEIGRVLPVVEKLVEEGFVVSVDSWNPAVMEEGLKAGAHIANDINGLRDERMVRIAAKYNAPAIAMHMRGAPRRMERDQVYNDVVEEVIDFFKMRLTELDRRGIRKVIIDPGFEFGKSVADNLSMLRRLGEFKVLGRPILVSASRKDFIGKVLGLKREERLEGTIAANVIAAVGGAGIVRVHDVREAKRAIAFADAVYKDLS
jgi:dihydropteroate synthase